MWLLNWYHWPNVRCARSQWNAHLQYWSTKCDKDINCYCGSLFVGYCTHEQMIEHYYEFPKKRFYCIFEWINQVLIMHFSRNYFISSIKRKILVFGTWELAVFTKFICISNGTKRIIIWLCLETVKNFLIQNVFDIVQKVIE